MNRGMHTCVPLSLSLLCLSLFYPLYYYMDQPPIETYIGIALEIKVKVIDTKQIGFNSITIIVKAFISFRQSNGQFATDTTF